MSKIRVTRTLVYEGEEIAMKEQLRNSYVNFGCSPCDFDKGRGSIVETSRKEEKLLSPAEEAWDSYKNSASCLVTCYVDSVQRNLKKAFLAGFEAKEVQYERR